MSIRQATNEEDLLHNIMVFEMQARVTLKFSKQTNNQEMTLPESQRAEKRK
jgi:hypothetical protein